MGKSLLINMDIKELMVLLKMNMIKIYIFEHIIIFLG